jgi:hypothetical protein
MKLPALAIATAFALGIACGLNPEIVRRSSSHAFIAFLLCSAATSLLIGIVLAVRSRLVIAGLGSLLCWEMLGVAAVLEISCFVACAELASITTSKRTEAPN